MENKKEILDYLKVTYFGFEEDEYMDVIEVGGPFRFNDFEGSEFMFMDFFPFVLKTGKSNHRLFLEKVENYLNNRERIKSI